MNEIYIIPKSVPVVVRITGGALSEETIDELKSAMNEMYDGHASSHYVIATPPGVTIELLAPANNWTRAPQAVHEE